MILPGRNNLQHQCIATFTVGEAMIEVSSGQIVVVPVGVPHKFVNSGTSPLRQVDIPEDESDE